jgi:hypothetical protein
MAKKVPQAAVVEWMGLCPCGCGAFRALLIDGKGKRLASFGWDEEGWVHFMAGVVRQIKADPLEDNICETHPEH